MLRTGEVYREDFRSTPHLFPDFRVQFVQNPAK